MDSHTHLLRLERPPGEAVRMAREAGVGAVVNIGTDVEDSRRGAELVTALPGVYSAAGIHPQNAGNYTAEDLEALAELLEEPGIVALGEVGLDYYREYWSKEVQQALFEDVISLANDTRIPLIIHNREAFDDTMGCLSRARVPVVLHCFEGGEREIREAGERGYYIGLAGNVTFRKSVTAGFLHLIDPGRLLIETDAPYLSPEPVRGTRNEPKNVVYTARFIAERLGMKPEELGRMTARNARDVFGLPLEV
ncbi:TatD family hydrolase [Rubrobacter taiwanensis]|uniref:TatD family hydrolase n=1 Tax=Rubrobacter taiwanensis TaxID=185139 RepID=UPI0014045E16|nr:TatD family hydrolase [Rubrobacter taiwanensis]